MYIEFEELLSDEAAIPVHKVNTFVSFLGRRAQG